MATSSTCACRTACTHTSCSFALLPLQRGRRHEPRTPAPHHPCVDAAAAPGRTAAGHIHLSAPALGRCSSPAVAVSQQLQPAGAPRPWALASAGSTRQGPVVCSSRTPAASASTAAARRATGCAMEAPPLVSAAAAAAVGAYGQRVARRGCWGPTAPSDPAGQHGAAAAATTRIMVTAGDAIAVARLWRNCPPLVSLQPHRRQRSHPRRWLLAGLCAGAWLAPSPLLGHATSPSSPITAPPGPARFRTAVIARAGGPQAAPAVAHAPVPAPSAATGGWLFEGEVAHRLEVLAAKLREEGVELPAGVQPGVWHNGLCPFCGGDGGREPLSFGLVVAADYSCATYRCWRANKCGVQQTVWALEQRPRPRRREAPRPQLETVKEELDQDALSYFASRGISASTLARAGVFQARHVPHPLRPEVLLERVVVYPYYRGGQMVNVTFHDIHNYCLCTPAIPETDDLEGDSAAQNAATLHPPPPQPPQPEAHTPSPPPQQQQPYPTESPLQAEQTTASVSELPGLRWQQPGAERLLWGLDDVTFAPALERHRLQEELAKRPPRARKQTPPPPPAPAPAPPPAPASPPPAAAAIAPMPAPLTARAAPAAAAGAAAAAAGAAEPAEPAGTAAAAGAAAAAASPPPGQPFPQGPTAALATGTAAAEVAPGEVTPSADGWQEDPSGGGEGLPMGGRVDADPPWDADGGVAGAQAAILRDDADSGAGAAAAARAGAADDLELRERLRDLGDDVEDMAEEVVEVWGEEEGQEYDDVFTPQGCAERGGSQAVGGERAEGSGYEYEGEEQGQGQTLDVDGEGEGEGELYGGLGDDRDGLYEDEASDGYDADEYEDEYDDEYEDEDGYEEEEEEEEAEAGAEGGEGLDGVEGDDTASQQERVSARHLELVIVESEEDRLSMMEAGITNVLALPPRAVLDFHEYSDFVAASAAAARDPWAARTSAPATRPGSARDVTSYLWGSRQVLSPEPSVVGGQVRVTLALKETPESRLLAEELATGLNRERCLVLRWPSAVSELPPSSPARAALMRGGGNLLGAYDDAGPDYLQEDFLDELSYEYPEQQRSQWQQQEGQWQQAQTYGAGDGVYGQPTQPIQPQQQPWAPSPPPATGPQAPSTVAAGTGSWETEVQQQQQQPRRQAEGQEGQPAESLNKPLRTCANDVLLHDGSEGLRWLVDSARPYPVRGLVDLTCLWDELVRHYYHKEMTAAAVSTGWRGLDELYRVAPGELTVVTGVPNSGKSHWLDALAVRLADLHGWRIAFASFEKSVVRHGQNLIELAQRKPMFYPDGRPCMTWEEFEMGRDWVNEHFVLIRHSDMADEPAAVTSLRPQRPPAPTPALLVAESDGRGPEGEAAAAAGDGQQEPFPDEDQELAAQLLEDAREPCTADWILRKATQAVHRYGIRGLIIDPYNELEQRRGAQSETEYVSAMLSKVKRWAQRHLVHVWLVAHPKSMEEWDGSPPTMYDISGSAHWYNKADIGLVVHRYTRVAMDAAARRRNAAGRRPLQFPWRENETLIKVLKARNKTSGTQGDYTLEYDKEECRFIDPKYRNGF